MQRHQHALQLSGAVQVRRLHVCVHTHTRMRARAHTMVCNVTSMPCSSLERYRASCMHMRAHTYPHACSRISTGLLMCQVYPPHPYPGAHTTAWREAPTMTTCLPPTRQTSCGLLASAPT